LPAKAITKISVDATQNGPAKQFQNESAKQKPVSMPIGISSTQAPSTRERSNGREAQRNIQVGTGRMHCAVIGDTQGQHWRSVWLDKECPKWEFDVGVPTVEVALALDRLEKSVFVRPH